MFKNKYGELPNREEMIKRMRDYIHTVVGRYKGRVLGWDVANECILDDGSWRQSPWYRAIGPDYIKLAFQFAHEADPGAELYYNDYSMSQPRKVQAVVRLVEGAEGGRMPHRRRRHAESQWCRLSQSHGL